MSDRSDSSSSGKLSDQFMRQFRELFQQAEINISSQANMELERVFEEAARRVEFVARTKEYQEVSPLDMVRSNLESFTSDLIEYAISNHVNELDRSLVLKFLFKCIWWPFCPKRKDRPKA